MLGRAAYQNPALLAEVDARFFGAAPVDLDAAIGAYADHVERQLHRGARLHPLIKPMLGLFNGRPGARLFRRHLSEHAPRADAGITVLREALSHVQRSARNFAA
jgi:tRNA-dihydrouridine synthase A